MLYQSFDESQKGNSVRGELNKSEVINALSGLKESFSFKEKEMLKEDLKIAIELAKRKELAIILNKGKESSLFSKSFKL